MTSKKDRFKKKNYRPEEIQLSPERMKFSICNDVERFRKESDIQKEDLAKILKISYRQLDNIIHCDGDKISLSTLQEIQKAIVSIEQGQEVGGTMLGRYKAC